MSKYTTITWEQFTDFLRADKGWEEVDTSKDQFPAKEHLLQWRDTSPDHPGLVLRVFTSILLKSEVGRKCGDDAIRVCAVVDTGKDIRGLVKSRRVFRVEGWRENLKAAIFAILTEARQRYKQSYAWLAKPKKQYDNPDPVDFKSTRFPEFRFKKDRLAWLRDKLATDKSWALWGLATIYQYQTEDEKLDQQTIEDNGVGFSGVDAEILTSFAQQFENKGWLSEKQHALLAKKIKKYARQLCKVLDLQGVALVGKKAQEARLSA